jgi:hypothetical protein
MTDDVDYNTINKSMILEIFSQAKSRIRDQSESYNSLLSKISTVFIQSTALSLASFGGIFISISSNIGNNYKIPIVHGLFIAGIIWTLDAVISLIGMKPQEFETENSTPKTLWNKDILNAKNDIHGYIYLISILQPIIDRNDVKLKSVELFARISQIFLPASFLLGIFSFDLFFNFGTLFKIAFGIIIFLILTVLISTMLMRRNFCTFF